MRNEIKQRVLDLAAYITENNATVRSAGQTFGVSKSTVHADVSKRLRYIDKQLWRQVSEVLKKNKDERHLRGGMATRDKYKRMRE